jgi:hypothetical protein
MSHRNHPIPVTTSLGLDIPHPPADLEEVLLLEGPQPELWGTRVVEPPVLSEVCGQPLGQRRQLFAPLLAVEKTGRPCDEQEEPGKPPRIDFIDELAQGIQPLLSGVGSNPLQGFDLVQNQNKTSVTRIPQDHEQTPEKI